MIWTTCTAHVCVCKFKPRARAHKRNPSRGIPINVWACVRACVWGTHAAAVSLGGAPGLRLAPIRTDGARTELVDGPLYAVAA